MEQELNQKLAAEQARLMQEEKKLREEHAKKLEVE